MDIGIPLPLIRSLIKSKTFSFISLLSITVFWYFSTEYYKYCIFLNLISEYICFLANNVTIFVSYKNTRQYYYKYQTNIDKCLNRSLIS